MAQFICAVMLPFCLIGLAYSVREGLSSGFRQEAGTIVFLLAMIAVFLWGLFHG